MKRNIVNIINFIRGVNPRQPGRDLVEPVINQIRLAKEYNLKTTFLIQYDAMIDKRYSELLIKEKNENIEIGGWFEVVQPLVEKAGLNWRGREGFSWDWHANVGFSVGYTPIERELLADIFMEEFENNFGCYPKSIGSWFMDAHILAYMEKRYSIKAACICRDQWGTDGYNLWGGYFSQAFYPCRNNMFSPAQSIENQINVPVFRMLGSDPIYQYDAGLEDLYTPSKWQPVLTLEPSYPTCGGNMDWVKWFFRENFENSSLSFGYTHVGQENSFGWKTMGEGLEKQIKYLSKQVEKKNIQVETLLESGEWYKAEYKVTPASSVTAKSDWKDEGHKSAWFCNRYYRANIFFKKDIFWIRDIHRFDEDYEERYLDQVCESAAAVYDNLPIVDGYRWCGNNIRSGLYLVSLKEEGDEIPLKGAEILITEDEEQLNVKWDLLNGSCIKIDCKEKAIEFSNTEEAKEPNWAVQIKWNPEADVPIINVDEKKVSYIYNKYSYCIKSGAGIFRKGKKNSEVFIYPENNRISIIIHE
jgi:hypothetical protein